MCIRLDCSVPLLFAFRKVSDLNLLFPIGSVQTDLNLTFVGNAEGRFCYIEAHTRKIYTDHTSNAKCFRKLTLINVRGLAEIIVPFRGYGRHSPH